MHAALLLALAFASPVSLFKEAEKKFEEFEQKFQKEYKSVEERARRLAVFVENLAVLEARKLRDHSATYSHLTPLMDWTVKEFNARNNLQVPKELHLEGTETLDVTDVPTDFDWREKGAVNAVKNQEQCGSCWAFATVANIEGVSFLANKKLLSLSEQELVDCEKTNHGCEGGLPSNAYQEMKQKHLGLELESDYPYKATDDECTAVDSKEKVFVSGFKPISQDEDQIAAAVVQYGPLAIGINANPMQMYQGGIADPEDCDPQELDHGVAIVGFGEEDGKKYWTIRNSWGAEWGEKGYYRLIRGVGRCGVNTVVTTATMDKDESLIV